MSTDFSGEYLGLELFRSKHVGMREAKVHLSSLIRQENEMTVVSRNGKPVVVFVPYTKMVKIIESLSRLGKQSDEK